MNNQRRKIDESYLEVGEIKSALVTGAGLEPDGAHIAPADEKDWVRGPEPMLDQP